MNRHPRVELLASKRLVSGRVFDVLEESVRLPSGLAQQLIVLEHPGAVAIAARLPDGKVLLVRQYRHAIGEWLVEVPAGRLDPGEPPLVAAQRELEEETGYRASAWTELLEFFPAPGFCSERMHVFLAEGLELAGPERRAEDEDEELELLELPLDEAQRAGGRDAKTWIALQALQLHLSEGDRSVRS